MASAVDELSKLNQRFVVSGAKLRQLVHDVQDEKAAVDKGSVSFEKFDERIQDWRSNMRTLAKIAEKVKEKAVPTKDRSQVTSTGAYKLRTLHVQSSNADGQPDDDHHELRPSEIALKMVTLKADIRLLSKYVFENVTSTDPHARHVMGTAEDLAGPATDVRNAAPHDRTAAYWQREVGRSTCQWPFLRP